MSTSGKVTILRPAFSPQVYTWQANTRAKRITAQTLEIAKKRAKSDVRSSTMGTEGAVIGVLAQYAATGLITATRRTKLFATAALMVIHSKLGKTDFVFRLNEYGQVVKIEASS